MRHRNKTEATHRAAWIMSKVCFPQVGPVNRMEGERCSGVILRQIPSHFSNLFGRNWPSILRLFLRCGPAAVAWLVITIVVHPVNGVQRRWPMAHIGKEIFKSQPTVTNFDSSPAIVFPMIAMRVSATSQHSGPYHIFGLCFAVARGPMSESQSSCDHFSAEASTTSCVSPTKTFSQGQYFFAAYTSAKPRSFTSDRRICRSIHKTNHREATECLA